LKFYSSIRINLKKIGVIKKQDYIIGIKIEAKTIKNKIAPPFQKTQFDILYKENNSKK